jgi:hypothetical protein
LTFTLLKDLPRNNKRYAAQYWLPLQVSAFQWKKCLNRDILNQNGFTYLFETLKVSDRVFHKEELVAKLSIGKVYKIDQRIC